MLETASSQAAPLRILAGAKGRTNLHWSAALARLFDASRRTIERVKAEIAATRLGAPSFLMGRAGKVGFTQRDVRDIMSNYSLELVSPFEETESIAGGLWSGRALFGDAYGDALAKLRFSAGTLDLPMHTHEHSDRLIIVAAGSGRFWWSDEHPASFCGQGINSVSVRSGNMLVFTRGLLHTFSAPRQPLTLLSYHTPEIPFEDPRQYSIPAFRWTPRIAPLKASDGH